MLADGARHPPALLGIAQAKFFDAWKALARYDAVLLLVPRSCAALLGRARVHVALGELEIAVEDLERCLDVADDDTPRDVRRSAAELLERCRGALSEKAPPR